MYGIATLKSSKNLTAAFTTQAQFAGGVVSPQIASMLGAVPALRAYAATPKLPAVIARGMLVARGWQDRFSGYSTTYTASMISDVLNNRQGVTDAVNSFVARMQDLYTPLK
jgi:predicted amidohydrolase